MWGETQRFFDAIVFVAVIALITLILINGLNAVGTRKEGELSNSPEISEDETESSGRRTTDIASEEDAPVIEEETTTSENQNVKYALSVSKTGAGTGSVSSTPSGINCGNIGSDCFEEYTEGMSVTLTPNGGQDSLFTGWSGDCSGTGSCNLVMNEARTAMALFEVAEQVSVSKIGSGAGTVTSSLAGINCGSMCSSLFPSGSPIQLTAVPDSGSQFISWGGCNSANSNICYLTPTSDRVIYAKFFLGYSLTVIKEGGGDGLVTSTPAGINCGTDCWSVFSPDTTVTLRLGFDANSYLFENPSECDSIDIDPLNPTVRLCIVQMDENKEVHVDFRLE